MTKTQKKKKKKEKSYVSACGTASRGIWIQPWWCNPSALSNIQYIQGKIRTVLRYLSGHKTGWLMGVCVTSRGTSKSMGDYLKCHAASRQGQSATGKLQLNRPFNWCWMFTRMLPHWSRHVYAVEFLEMSHFFHPSAVLDNCHMFNWLWPEEVMLINSIGPSIQWFK